MKVMNKVDVTILEDVVSLLKPFYDVTNIMSSETSSSVSLIRPLHNQLMQVSKPDPALENPTAIHTAKASIFHDLETR